MEEWILSQKDKNSMTKNIHYIATESDYYYCSFCSENYNELSWHKVNYDTSKIGFTHLQYIDINKCNSPDARYFYCSKCKKWHKASKSPECILYRCQLKKAKNHDTWIKNPDNTIIKEKNPDKHIRFSQYDGVFWFNEDSYLKNMKPVLKEKLISLLNDLRLFSSEYSIQVFNRIHGMTFITKGLKTATLSIKNDGCSITLERNPYAGKGLSVNKTEQSFNFEDISNTAILNHLKEEAINISDLRVAKKIGYSEKYLHSLLIENMNFGEFHNLKYLYYEAPGGRIGSGRTHIDILAKDLESKDMVVIEVKKANENLDDAIWQGLSYLMWVRKNDYQIQAKTDQLDWDVNVQNTKLMIIAPGKLSPQNINTATTNYIHRNNFSVDVISLEHSWEIDENLNIFNEFKV